LFEIQAQLVIVQKCEPESAAHSSGCKLVEQQAVAIVRIFESTTCNVSLRPDSHRLDQLSGAMSIIRTAGIRKTRFSILRLPSVLTCTQVSNTGGLPIRLIAPA